MNDLLICCTEILILESCFIWFNSYNYNNLYILVLDPPAFFEGVATRVGLFVVIFFIGKKPQKRIFTAIPNANDVISST
ncbi:MAG TPA: hypothetical protein DER05_12295 [Lutibacter sp.]|nr:hypothetical protein [Lutibacter sp.]